MNGKRALRYPTLADMPDGMRRMVEKASIAVAMHMDRLGEPEKEIKPKRRPSQDAEHHEQAHLMNRIRTLAMNDARYAPAAERIYAIPNGGGRSKREAGRLKAEGVRAGVSDTFTSYPVGDQHGLYLEMKSMIGSPSREQSDWIQGSVKLGYAAACCRGADAAFKVWKAYVEESFTS